MTQEARIRIDAHPLMQTNARGGEYVAQAGGTSGKRAGHQRLVKHTVVHLALFTFSFLATVGAAVVSVLLWVRPEAPVTLVLLGLVSSVFFVACFVGLRILALRSLTDAAADDDDGLDTGSHAVRSIVYGCIALIFALLLAGLLINAASAVSPAMLPSGI